MKKRTVSIVVTARNNGKYLKECLESCLNQTVKPIDIIYSDDCSTDNSIKIASKLKGITIVPHIKHVGVVIARNAGVLATKGTILVHVDGDDILPTDFLEKHLTTLTDETPFVYCAAQAFGTHNTLWNVHEWGKLFLWHQNFVNTSCMVWKDKFIEAGMWLETCENTMWDWSLAIRLSRLGTPAKSPAVLLYRQHPESYSESHERAQTDGIVKININIRRCLVTMSIGLIYSGRLETLMPYWLDALLNDISILKNKPQLIIVNNSQRPLNWITSYHKQFFSEVIVLKGVPQIQFKEEKERRIKVSQLMADCSNMIMKRATGELIHFREDDMITNKGAFEKLFNFITDITVDKKRAGVGALYLNRHWNRIVGGIYNTTNPQQTQDFKESEITTLKPVQVDYTGTGCLLFWKDLCPPRFFPQINNINAHDWRFGMDIKALGKTLYILPDAICRHYKSIHFDYLEPDAKTTLITPPTTFSKISR